MTEIPRPVVDRDALADIIYRAYHDPANAFDTIPEGLAADAILASGVVQDANDIRAQARREVAEEIAAAIEATRDSQPRDRSAYSAYTRAAFDAREVGDR